MLYGLLEMALSFENTPMATIEPDTDLTMSALIPMSQGNFVPLAAKGDHVSLLSESELETIL